MQKSVTTKKVWGIVISIKYIWFFVKLNIYEMYAKNTWIILILVPGNNFTNIYGTIKLK